MTAFILFVYTSVAGYSSGTVRDWRPVGEFYTAQACEDARELLGPVFKEASRCISKGSK